MHKRWWARLQHDDLFKHSLEVRIVGAESACSPSELFKSKYHLK
jgi:hypothetical protein